MLKMNRDLFGNYMEVFARHLNVFYASLASDTGKFLDIGGTGSTASGMKQVGSKFLHFAGKLQYWMLDSDPAARSLPQTLVCDITNCSEAASCEYDVTFSHGVLEHVRRPWAAFDQIARITKRGGLTLHMVPWSYHYHATPGDYFRFSHQALESMMEDRGFTVLDRGYDVCTKQKSMVDAVDEHYDTIWLSYVVGQKN